MSWTESAEAHIARRQVAPHEVEEGPLQPGPAISLPAAAAPGWCSPATAAGRHLLVVIADAPDGGVGIVTARAMTDTEKRAFAQEGS